MMYRNGEIGSPYLNPLLDVMYPLLMPFIMIEYEQFDINLQIISFHLSSNPNFLIILIRSCQLRESYAFEISSFIMRLDPLTFVLMDCMSLLARRMLSFIILPFTKPLYSSE